MNKELKNIVILTGAGISAESGLKTFRDSDGLWEGHRIEEVATPEAFLRNPDLVNEFYNLRRAQLQEVEPNLAHLALGQLVREWQYNVLIVTQNVDDLHDRVTPSESIIHIHGELLKARCTDTLEVCEWRTDILPNTDSPYSKHGSLRPHIVWFGEMPLMMSEIYKALRNCDLFVSIGTSGNVYPAAGFVNEARRNGAYCIELNLEPSLGAHEFHESRNGKASEIVPAFVNNLLKSKI
jgi:NAD-dependent deacetylase